MWWVWWEFCVEKMRDFYRQIILVLISYIRITMSPDSISPGENYDHRSVSFDQKSWAKWPRFVVKWQWYTVLFSAEYFKCEMVMNDGASTTSFSLFEILKWRARDCFSVVKAKPAQNDESHSHWAGSWLSYHIELHPPARPLPASDSTWQAEQHTRFSESECMSLS